MSDRRLKTVTQSLGHNAALKDGSAGPEGYTLEFEEVPNIVQAFRRMVRGLEFDVCEMAITTYLSARAYGKPFTALPIFLVRAFHHGAIVKAANSDVREPGDLAGRTVGVNRGYTVTTGVWARGILNDEYGVDPDGVTWVISGDEHVAEFQYPANVEHLAEGAELPGALAAGELAAAIGVPAAPPERVTLIPDPVEAGYAALRERGHYPINHLVVVKDEVLAAHPGLATALFEAFTESKNRYVERLRSEAIAEPTPADTLHKRVMEITGSDPLPYGIEPNRTVLEEIVRHATSQRILDSAPAIESLFAEETRGLVGVAP